MVPSKTAYQDGSQLVIVEGLHLIMRRQLLAESNTHFPGLAQVQQLDGLFEQQLLTG